MNLVILTNAYLDKKGVELKIVGNDKMVATFSIAVKKAFKEKEYNYFNCVIWGKRAEWLANNQDKVNKVGVNGRLETRSYEAKDGTKKYVTEIICNDVEVQEWKKEDSTNNAPIETNKEMTPVDDGEDMPFR